MGATQVNDTYRALYIAAYDLFTLACVAVPIAVGAWVCVQLWKAARPRGMATKCTRFPP